MKFLILLISSLFLIASCRTQIYTIKLDPQLYTMPFSYNQKPVGLIYYKKSNMIISFNSEEALKTEVKNNVKSLGGNRIIPLNLVNSSGSIVNQIRNKTHNLFIKGFIVNDISD